VDSSPHGEKHKLYEQDIQVNISKTCLPERASCRRCRQSHFDAFQVDTDAELAQLAAHTITTNWVLGNEYAGSPLVYHWRVLPDTAPEGFADEFGGLEGAVAHWDGSPAARHRPEAISRSSPSLVIFLEHVPYPLADWRANHRDDAAVYLWAANLLDYGAAFMSSRKFIHFDAHFTNILTDGRLVYLADMGLHSAPSLTCPLRRPIS
jgi:hypothetical protein